jgi:hypothetical protein
METIYDYCILITTYNRTLSLNNLLNQIKEQAYNKKIKIIILDDGSDENLNELDSNITYIKILPNRGKKGFHKIIDYSFKLIKNIKSEYYFYLQDDIILKENFFQKAIEIFENIQDEKKIVLSTLICESQKEKSKWSDFKPIRKNDVYLCQWCELFFVTKYDFFELLNFQINEINKERWKFNNLLSSGVGEQITNRINNLNKNMYVVADSLILTTNEKSKMNPIEREKNPLIAI